MFRSVLLDHTHPYFFALSAAEVHELKAIRDALAAIAPTKAIWKLHPTDLISLKERNVSLDIPANVLVTPFAPQNSLLGHPQMRAFLTQGGTNSFLEVGMRPLLGCAQCCSASQQHGCTTVSLLAASCSVCCLSCARCSCWQHQELHHRLYSRARQFILLCQTHGLVLKLSLGPGSPAGCLAWPAHRGPPTHAGAARQRCPCRRAGAPNMCAGLRFLSSPTLPSIPCRARKSCLQFQHFCRFTWKSPARMRSAQHAHTVEHTLQGWGLRVDYKRLEQEPHLLREALTWVLGDPAYSRVAQQKSQLLQAHSRHPRQRAAGDMSVLRVVASTHYNQVFP